MNIAATAIAARAIVAAILLPLALHGQNIRPVPPMMYPEFTTFTLSMAQMYNSMTGAGNLCNANLYWNTSKVSSLGPFAARTNGTLKLGISYVDDAATSQDLRVTENEFFLEQALIYPAGLVINPYISGSIRTPVTESFIYSQQKSLRYGKLWDPVTSMEGAGGAYMATSAAGYFNARFGIAFQQIRAEAHPMITDDWETRDVVEKYKARTGIEHASELNIRLDSTTTYMARMNAFSSFEDLSVWSARYEGELQFQFWRFLSFNWRLQIVHDVQQSRRTQFSHYLSLGLLYSL